MTDALAELVATVTFVGRLPVILIEGVLGVGTVIGADDGSEATSIVYGRGVGVAITGRAT